MPPSSRTSTVAGACENTSPRSAWNASSDGTSSRSPATYASLGTDVATVTVTGDRGSVTMPVEVVEDMTDGTVWVPASSSGAGVLAGLASPGSRVSVKGAGA